MVAEEIVLCGVGAVAASAVCGHDVWWLEDAEEQNIEIWRLFSGTEYGLTRRR